MITAISIALHALAAVLLGGAGVQIGKNSSNSGAVGITLFAILFVLAAALQVLA